MENSSLPEEKKKNRILNWLKNPDNLGFMIILLFIIGLRFYYFILTKDQPVWWDESEYLSKAKAIAGLVSYDSVSIRSPIFPGVLSIFFFLGITNEVVMRFFALFLPSILVVILTYFLVRQMYPDKRIALLSMIIMGVLWEHVFYSNRFHTENIALLFEFLALIVFYKSYLKKEKTWFINPKYSLIYVFLLTLISFLFRPGNIIFAPPLILFILLLNKDKVLTKKWLMSGAVFVVAIIASFIFTDIPQSFLKQYLHLDWPIGWNSMTAFYGFFQSVITPIPSLLFYAFLIGFFIVLFKVLLIGDKIKNLKPNSEDLEFKSNILNLLLLLGIVFLFVFIMRATLFEYRWFFPLLPAMLAFTGKGVIEFSSIVVSLIKYKNLSKILILVLLLFGAYNQVVHADSIIKLKVDSYSQVRDAAIWLKQNFDKSEQVMTVSYPQTVYYSEMKVLDYSEITSSSAFEDYLNVNKPRLLEVSGFENHPAWTNDWLSANQERAKPIKVYFADAEQKQPILIIYEIVYV
jgi:hypothetical protein